MNKCGILTGMKIIFISYVIICVQSDIKISNQLNSRQKAPYSWTTSNALARTALVERQEYLQDNCEEILATEKFANQNLTSNYFRNILVDDNLQLLYCYVPKAACTNWKRVLMIATGKWPNDDPLEIPANLTHAAGTFKRLSNFTMPEIEHKLATYDTLIVVRHPLERLLSAYRNKLETQDEKSSKYFQTRFGRKIVKKYRKNPKKESIAKGNDVTFSEFVDYITDDEINGRSNEHWKPIYDLCQPCKINYNLISKYESLDEEAPEILERIGAGSITFPKRPQSYEPTRQKLEHYYSKLTLKQLRKLTNLYKLDLKLFGYTLEEVLGFSLA